MKSERPQPEDFIFPEGYLKALIPGETGSVDQDTARQNLRQKISNFDLRLQCFIDDICFLYQTDEYEHLDHLLQQMAKIDKRDDVGNWNVWDTDVRANTQQERDFGAALSQIARPILESTDRFNEKEVAWGFLMGLISEPIDDYDDREEHFERIDDIVNSFEEYINHRKIHANETIELDFEVGLRREEVLAIQNLGFVPTNTLANVGSRLARRHALELNSEWKEVGGYEPKPLEIGNFEEVWESVLIDLVGKYGDLHRINSLRKDLDEDYGTASESKWNNIWHSDVIRSIHKWGGEAEAVEIADDIKRWQGDPKINPQGVGKPAADLAGVGEDTGGPNWKEPSILNISCENPMTWEFTKYGELLSFVHIEAENGYNQLHAYALSPDDCVKKDLITEVLEKHYKPRAWDQVDAIRYNVTQMSGSNPS